ncbi:MAG: OmpA family protein [Oligoflexus sp.]|nr:OmpA family protein [Oligoflexus sp.]
MSRLQSMAVMGLVTMSLWEQSVLANSQHEDALRVTLSPLVESAATRNSEAARPLDSGLKLQLREGSDPLPEKISYSLNVSTSSSKGDNALGAVTGESGGSLAPGLYDLAIQENDHEVFRKQILAMDKVLSGLEISYSHTGGYTLRQTIELPQLKFAPGQRKLAKPSFAVLKDLVTFLNKEESIEVFAIEVHTDANGDAEMNKELTEARAIEVRNYLVKNGVDAQRVRAAGFGAAHPLASNETKEGRLLNRRVEYVILETSGQPKLLGDR